LFAVKIITMINHIADLSRRNAMFPVAAGSNLLDAVKLMARNHVQRYL
jgi:hypothetical protein